MKIDKIDKDDRDLNVVNFKKFLKKHKDKTAREQAIIFKRDFGRGYRTYHRLKRAVRKGITYAECCNEKTYRRIINNISECYFCEKDSKLVVHHIDLNKKNDKKKNLLILCNQCHNRLHNLLKKNHIISIEKEVKKIWKKLKNRLRIFLTI